MSNWRIAKTGLLILVAALLGTADVPADQVPAGPTAQYLVHLSSDKPIYRAGERVYLRGVVLGADDHKPLAGDANGQWIYQAAFKITGPKGEIIAQGADATIDSVAAWFWQVPDGAAGGQYTATITLPSAGFPPAVRKFEVRAYRAPRLKGEIIFLRDGFGPGDTVKASLHVDRAEGGVPAGAAVNANAIVDGQQVYTGATKLDEHGNCAVEFKLPAKIENGDGTLSLAVTDGGTVEPISKTIPILVNKLDVRIYPEGGDLVAGLPCRVYVEARTPAQKPADIAGSVVDGRGNAVAEFRTEHEGRGRFMLTPKAGETYALKLTQPAGIDKTFALPAAKDAGAILASDQDVYAAGDAVKLTLTSSADATYTVTLNKREWEISSLKVDALAGQPAHVAMTPPAQADGVLVATVKDAASKPVAERLVFRQPRSGLIVKITPDKSSYVPAGEVSLSILTTDDAGKPVPAVVGMCVTDDSVLKMIEKRDRAPHLPVMVLLEDDVKELADAEIYLDKTDAKAPLATDLLLGTQGWRRFANVNTAKFLQDFGDQAKRVLAIRQPVPIAVHGAFGAGGGGRDFVENGVPEELAMRRMAVPGAAAAPRPMLAVPAAGKAEGQIAAADFKDMGPVDQLRRAGPMIPATRPSVWQRVYAHDLLPGHKPGQRVDFTETLYWNPAIKTDAAGLAKASFKLSDAVTSFSATADAFDEKGALGEGSAVVQSVQPFYVEPKLPLEVSSGDVIHLPIAAVNGTGDALPVKLTITAPKGIEVSEPAKMSLQAGDRLRQVVDVKIASPPLEGDFAIHADGGAFADDVTRKLVVRPLGFPTETGKGGMIDANSAVSYTLDVPNSLVPGSMTDTIAVYPTPAGNLSEALKRLLQEPYGCFEQTTSTTYPLIMTQQYFLSHTNADASVVKRAADLLQKGYDRLRGFECKNKGYEWFGEDPGHECLSAYGLLEFTDMSQVRQVDAGMLQNTRDWLLKQRDGKGGFNHERRALHTWVADPGCSNGYCTWALLECGQTGLEKEVAWLKDRAQTDVNSYVTALAANALYLAGDRDGAKAMMVKLAKLQEKDGHVSGATTSVVGSGGQSLAIETTSLAALAWLRDPAYFSNTQNAVKFLADSCQGGRYGSTQSTVLALRAIIGFDKAAAHPTAPGKIQLFVDNVAMGDPLAFDQSTTGAITLPDIAGLLTPGRHAIELHMSGGSSLPFVMGFQFNSQTPSSSDQCAVSIETALKDQRLDEGAASQVDVTVANRTDQIIPTPIAIVGLPGGLEVRHEQLKELVKAGRIAAYEVRGREVILYWRDMQANEKVQIPLSVIAAVPGDYTGPASRAYLYYTDEFKQWQDGLKVSITPR